MNEADRIERLAEQRRSEASEKHLPELLVRLYHHRSLPYLPLYKSRGDRCSVPGVVKEARGQQQPAGEREKEIIVTELLIEDEWLIFKKHNERSDFRTGFFHDLDIGFKGHRVFSLSVICEPKEWGNEYRPCRVGAYIPGDWERYLALLDQGFIQVEAARQESEKHDPKKLERLKDDFGIQ